MTDQLDVLREIAAGFDTHDLDRIMRHFADDAVFESPRGPEAFGQRFEGIAAVREAFAGRFAGILDVRYQEDEHFVAGDRGASEWTLRGTTTDGRGSRSAAATCGPSATARWSGRTRTGSCERRDPVSIPAGVSIVTLGVRNVARSVAF